MLNNLSPLTFQTLLVITEDYKIRPVYIGAALNTDTDHSLQVLLQVLR